MNTRTTYVIIAVVVVLAVLGYSFGWFGGSAPPPAAITPAPTQPATPPATPAPAQ